MEPSIQAKHVTAITWATKPAHPTDLMVAIFNVTDAKSTLPTAMPAVMVQSIQTKIVMAII